MKLDTRSFRYLSQEDWRVLTAVELGSKSHEVVPTPLIASLASLRTGTNGVHRSISSLAKAGLIGKDRNIKYDGYRLTYGGFDYLALRSLTSSGKLLHLGSQMGVGKESDIYLVTSPAQLKATLANTPTIHVHDIDQHAERPPESDILAEQSILKIHRLGRISFRTLRTNRAYTSPHHGQCSWQHLSRLSATKEFSVMRALHAAGFPVPRPIAHSRHAIVMSLIPGIPLRQVPLDAFSRIGGKGDDAIAALYGELIELSLQLADVGLIHGDFNEFNILIGNVPEPTDENDGDTPGTNGTAPVTEKLEQAQMKPYLIDFPQITSLAHPNAEYYFTRDIECIKSFFRKRYHFTPSSSGPTFADARARLDHSQRQYAASRDDAPADTRDNTLARQARYRRLDVQVEAAGYSRKGARMELERYYAARGEGQAEDENGSLTLQSQTGEEQDADDEVGSYDFDVNDDNAADDDFGNSHEILSHAQQGTPTVPRPDFDSTMKVEVPIAPASQDEETPLDKPAVQTAVQAPVEQLQSLSLASALAEPNSKQARSGPSAKAKAGWSI